MLDDEHDFDAIGEDDEMDERTDIHEVVEHLRESLTYDMAMKAYECRYGRTPEPSEDLEAFIDELISEAYNAGYDDWNDEFLYYD